MSENKEADILERENPAFFGDAGDILKIRPAVAGESDGGLETAAALPVNGSNDLEMASKIPGDGKRRLETAGDAPGRGFERLMAAAAASDKKPEGLKMPGAASGEDAPGQGADLAASRPARVIKLTLAYDGGGFLGWQRQARMPTLQQTLEEALARLCGHEVAVHASGRTDAGVHARGQVASFRTSSSRTLAELVRGSNAILPFSMAVLSAEEAEPDFNARFSCKGKTYVYDFLASKVRDPLQAGRVWFVGPNLDWEAVSAALPHLIGEMDFSAFRSVGTESKSAVRTITEAALDRPEADLRRLTLTGTGFLRHMVRSIAGTLWLVGRRKLAPDDLKAIIASKNRSMAGPVAPPQGLRLERVYYGEGPCFSLPKAAFDSAASPADKISEPSKGP